MDVSPSVTLYLVSALTSAALALYGWLRWHYRGAGPFSLLMAALAFWSLCHALSVRSNTFDGAFLWARIQYGGIVMVGPLFLCFALAYTDQWWRVTRRFQVGLLALPALAYLAVLTNSYHHLWWTVVEPDTSRAFLSLYVERGPLFWVHMIYSYLCLLTGLGLFLQKMFDSSTPYKHQARLMVISAFIPLVGNIAHLMGFKTTLVDDPTPFLLLGTGLVIAYASWRYQLFDLAPIAQREIFASIPDGMVVLDQRGFVTEINDLASHLLAVNPSRWVGRPLLETIAGSPLADELHDLLALPAVPRTSRVLYESDNGLCGVEIQLRPLHAHTSDQPVGTLLLLRDSTERVRMEQALDQRFTELTLINQIARAANAAVHTNDLVRSITRAMVQTLTWDRVAIALLDPGGQSLRMVVDQTLDDHPQLEGQTVAAANYGPVLEIIHARQSQIVDITDPCLIATPTGRMLQRLKLDTVLIVPLYSKEEPLGVLFVGHTGTTELSPALIRLAETIGELITEAIVRAHLHEEAEQANQLKSSFLAMVSHELRTPLSSIIGYADMLRRGIYGMLPETALTPVDYIRHSSHNLGRLINDFLDFSKMDAGHFTVELYAVDLLSVVQYVVLAMQPQIQERGLELVIDLAPDLPRVQGNSARLEQVLTNLLSNAIKFTDTGRITVRAEPYGESVRLSVTDTGIGIAPEYQSLIFHHFHQIENAHTRRHGGTGLGLAISRRLVELMGGTLDLESTPDIGSTFSCYLPVATRDLKQVGISG